MDDSVLCKLCLAAGCDRKAVEAVVEDIRETDGVRLRILGCTDGMRVGSGKADIIAKLAKIKGRGVDGLHVTVDVEKGCGYITVGTAGGGQYEGLGVVSPCILAVHKGRPLAVHGAALQHAKTALISVRRTVHMTKPQFTSLTLAAHGSAAAAATLLSLLLVSEGMFPTIDITLVTFGAPLVHYSPTWSTRDVLKQHRIRHRIYVNHTDAVPRCLVSTAPVQGVKTKTQGAKHMGMYSPLCGTFRHIEHTPTGVTVKEATGIELLSLLTVRVGAVSRKYHSLPAYFNALRETEGKHPLCKVPDDEMPLPEPEPIARLRSRVALPFPQDEEAVPDFLKDDAEHCSAVIVEVRVGGAEAAEAVYWLAKNALKYCMVKEAVLQPSTKLQVLDAALRMLDDTCKMLPRYRSVLQELKGVVYNNRGCIKKKEGHRRPALDDLLLAVDLSPSTEAFTNLSAVQLALNMPRDALRTSRAAVDRLRPLLSINETVICRSQYPRGTRVTLRSGEEGTVTSHCRGRIGVTLDDELVLGCVPAHLMRHPSNYPVGSQVTVGGRCVVVTGHARGRIGVRDAMGAVAGVPACNVSFLDPDLEKRASKELVCVHNYMTAAVTAVVDTTDRKSMKLRRWEGLIWDRVALLGDKHPLVRSLSSVPWEGQESVEQSRKMVLPSLASKPKKKKVATVVKPAQQKVPEAVLRRREEGWCGVGDEDEEMPCSMFPVVMKGPPPKTALKLEEVQYKEATKRRVVNAKQLEARQRLRFRELRSHTEAEETSTRYGIRTAAERGHRALKRARVSKGVLITQQLLLLTNVVDMHSAITEEEAAAHHRIAQHASILLCTVTEHSNRYITQRLEAKEHYALTTDCHRGVQEMDMLRAIKAEILQ